MGPTYKGRDLWHWPIPDSGFEYSGVLEMYLCALEWGIEPQKWDDLSPDYQALCLAVYRSKQRIAAVTDHWIVNRP